MRTLPVALIVSLISAVPLAAQTADLAASAQAQLPALTEVYKNLHRTPELSQHEEKTSAFLAGELRKLDYTVTEHVGKYEDGSPAFGIVALLENGPGKRLLLRTDMDALPVEEKTGLDYASTVHSKNAQGQDVGVMHACGHDLHMTVLLGTAREMAARKKDWHGTLMLIGQPSEEIIQGARAMLADHLYDRFGKPDLIVAEHDFPDLPAGSVAFKSGPMLASATTLTVTMRGIGSHGSAPQAGKDPIVLAAEFVLVAQTIVSRQVDPQQPAVLTVGMIHGGTKNNIIPDEVTMGLTLRTFSLAVRDQVVAAITRTANGLAEAYGIPADRMPIVTMGESTPVTFNNPALNDRIKADAESALGKEHVFDGASAMGSEDVGAFSLEGQIPEVMYSLGVTESARLADHKKAGKPMPSLHSALFYPDTDQAIPAGVTAMTAIALDLLH